MGLDLFVKDDSKDCHSSNREYYTEFKSRRTEEIEALPIMHAFSPEEFKFGINAVLGLTEEDKDKVTSIGNGIYCKKEDLHMILSVFDKQQRELELAKKDKVFLQEMIKYELWNNEYEDTGNVDPILNILNITKNDLEENVLISDTLNKVLNEIDLEEDEDFEDDYWD